MVHGSWLKVYGYGEEKLQVEKRKVVEIDD